MAIKITSEQLRDAVMEALSDYRDEVNEGVRKAIQKQANEDVRELKATSPKKKQENMPPDGRKKQ